MEEQPAARPLDERRGPLRQREGLLQHKIVAVRDRVADVASERDELGGVGVQRFDLQLGGREEGGGATVTGVVDGHGRRPIDPIGPKTGCFLHPGALHRLLATSSWMVFASFARRQVCTIPPPTFVSKNQVRRKAALPRALLANQRPNTGSLGPKSISTWQILKGFAQGPKLHSLTNLFTTAAVGTTAIVPLSVSTASVPDALHIE